MICWGRSLNKRMLLCVLCGMVYAGGCDAKHESLGERLEHCAASGASSFDFEAETDFGWDRMYVFGPYSSRARVEESLGFTWKGFEHTTIEMSDAVCLVVFVSDEKVVHWYEQARAVDLLHLVDEGGYRPSEASFSIVRTGGRAVLRSKRVDCET